VLNIVERTIIAGVLLLPIGTVTLAERVKYTIRLRANVVKILKRESPMIFALYHLQVAVPVF